MYYKEYTNTNYGKNPNNLNEEEWGVPIHDKPMDSSTSGALFKQMELDKFMKLKSTLSKKIK